MGCKPDAKNLALVYYLLTLSDKISLLPTVAILISFLTSIRLKDETSFIAIYISFDFIHLILHEVYSRTFNNLLKSSVHISQLKHGDTLRVGNIFNIKLSAFVLGMAIVKILFAGLGITIFTQLSDIYIFTLVMITSLIKAIAILLTISVVGSSIQDKFVSQMLDIRVTEDPQDRTHKFKVIKDETGVLEF